MIKLRTSSLALALVLFASPADAQIGPVVSSCGTVIDDGVCTPIFLADTGGTWVVPGLDQFQLGDRVFVDGTIHPACDPFCAGPTACLIPSTISSCDAGVSFCTGDGGDQLGCTDCPCGNNAPVGSLGGCLNGNGTAAKMDAEGDASVTADTLRVEVAGANPNTFGVLISGANALPMNPANPCPPGSGVISTVLDGLRCVGGNVLRHGSRATDTAGAIGETTPGWGAPDGPPGGIVANGGFVAGETRNFQVFYREDAALVCQTGQNTTNAIGVTIQN